MIKKIKIKRIKKIKKNKKMFNNNKKTNKI